MQLQFSEAHFAEVEKMQRTFSDQEWAILDQAFVKLLDQGLTQTPDNYLTIVRTYNNYPTVKFTVDDVIQMVLAENNRPFYQWLSAEQIEYNKLQEQLGQEQSDLLHRLLPRHGLVDNQTNFVLLGKFHLNSRWPINQNTFQRAIDALRFTPGGYKLVWAPTPDEIRVAREAKEAREAVKPDTRTPLQKAQARAAMVEHIRDEITGERMSAKIMREFYENHPEANEPEVPATPTRTTAGEPGEAYFEGRVRDFIRSIRSSITRERAQAEFGKSKYANWQLTFAELQSWYSKQGVR